VRDAMNLLQSDDVTALLADVEAWIAEHGTPSAGIPEDPALFVFDTMARCMPGGDENSAQDVGLVIAAADRIRQRTGAAVLLVHHTQKGGELERGSSALRGAADSMFYLRPEDVGLILETTKQKDALAAEPRRLRLMAVAPSCVIEPWEGPTQEIGPNVRHLLETIQAVSIERETTASILIETVRLSRANVYRCLKIAVDRGLVQKRGAKYSLTASGEVACLTSLRPISAVS